ncbi:MAG: histidine phosphatase family protein [Acidobacteria bacterium]|nr:MAG: histidine phosphatase family protein [Acidobacteriota bacterium]
MSNEQKWPDVLWIVRHGESAGNVARDEAEAAGLPLIDIKTRDVDVPLSEMGEHQATALGNWFRKLPIDAQPTIVLASPYVRARETARRVLEAAGIDTEEITFLTDERLREREFGIFDRLTRVGIQDKYPDLAEARTALGKFYFRPPGGESWCDVILRLRSVIGSITRDYRRERVLVVSHQVVVNCFRYLLERMTEDEILAIDKAKEIANCSVTSYEFNPNLGRHGKLTLQLYNFCAPLEEAGAPITTKPDVPVAPK